MNGLFIVYEDLTEYSGISKKIRGQIEGFRKNGIRMVLSSLILDKRNEGNFYGRTVEGQLIEKFAHNNLLNKLQRLSRHKSLFYYIVRNEIDLVYIRYVHTANPYFISFLRKLNKKNVKVLLEVPTFPYDQEYKQVSFKHKLLLAIEKIYRKKLKYYIKNIITFSNAVEIFEVPTIRISNGVDIKDIKLVLPVESVQRTEIHLIGVATLCFWHGYDRLLKGLKKFYSSKQNKLIYFHIVGDTNRSEAKKYKCLVDEYNLHEHVIFHGRRSGEKLDHIFNYCQMGIGCLGVHRKGITYIKSIKNREYCARGIPFIYSELDEDFEEKPFILKAPQDESPIDINQIIEFLETKKFDKNEIRNYAANYLTWNSQIEKVIKQANIQVY